MALSAFAQQWGPSAYGNRYSHGSSSDRTLTKGYRGMVEMAHGFGWDQFYYAFEYSTTYGYQFNPYLYLGGVVSFGRGESKAYSYDTTTPGFNFGIGSDFRVYMSQNKLAPFAGLQFGFDLCGDNLYMLLKGQLGLRYALNDNHAINIAAVLGPTCESESGEVLFKLGVEF